MDKLTIDPEWLQQQIDEAHRNNSTNMGGLLLVSKYLITNHLHHPSIGLQKEVTACEDCPFFNNEYFLCNHPQRPKESTIIWDYEFHHRFITPDWCPLKKEPITISFKQ